MRTWIAKICLFVAVLIITAHNSIPHDHDEVTLAGHHDHDDEEEEDHDVFSYNFLAHSFTPSAVSYTIRTQIAAEVPGSIVYDIPEAVNSYFFVVKISCSEKYEYPPPLREPSSVGFCGPPLTV